MRVRLKSYKNRKFKVLKRLTVIIKRLIIIDVYIIGYLFPACFKVITNNTLK